MRASLMLLCFASLQLIAGAAFAQTPFPNGFSVGSGVEGAPMASWQQIGPSGDLAGRVSLAPADAGYTATLAASRAFGQGRWLFEGGFGTAADSQLSSRSAHLGLTFTVPGSNAGLLQTTLGLSYAGGNGVMLDSGLWPVAGGTQSALFAGLRWSPTPLASLHITASRITAGVAIAEQEIALNAALSPALVLSLGAHTQQNAGWGMLTSAALRWQPRLQSPFAISLESDVARGYYYEPFLGDQAVVSSGRRSGQTTFAMLDAPLTPTLTLRIGVSLDSRLHLGGNGLLGPGFAASLLRGL